MCCADDDTILHSADGDGSSAVRLAPSSSCLVTLGQVERTDTTVSPSSASVAHKLVESLRDSVLCECCFLLGVSRAC